MKRKLDPYKFVQKTSTYILFLLIIGFSFYYLFDTGLDYFSAVQSQDQVQNQAPDPLDDSGRPVNPARRDVQTMNTLAGESEQDNTTDVQKAKVLNSIKVNETVTDIQKQQIMQALGGNKK